LEDDGGGESGGDVHSEGIRLAADDLRWEDGNLEEVRNTNEGTNRWNFEQIRITASYGERDVGLDGL